MEHELLIRLSAFLGAFALFAGLERFMPRRVPVGVRSRRWLTNGALVVIDSLTLRLLALWLPLLAVGAAMDAAHLGLGLFNATRLPGWAEGLASILILDFAIWFQHLATHKVPLFWRFHRVHHADRDVDVSTALRFHPVEIAASMVLKIALVYLIGAPPFAVLAFEVILNATAIFSHANLLIPPWLEQPLRLLLVTPEMHRIHHSQLRADHDSNYGFALSFWDRLFRTWRDAPVAGHDALVTGLEWHDDRPAQLGFSLLLPFRK